MPDNDILVWGASGFTGKLVCEHILQNYDSQLTWAMAGRNRTKLEEVQKELAKQFPAVVVVPILTADISDSASMLKLTSKTRVLLSTAGPYSQLGTPVLWACLETKTQYADINGELEWMRHTIEEFHDRAMKSGVKFIHCCGWDCAPADLGVLFLAQQTAKTHQRKLAKVTNLVTDIVGAFSGGSLNTALLFYSEPFKALFPHPYSLNPKSQQKGKDGQQFLGAWYETDTGHFTSPSFFAPADMRIVRRSNCLLGNSYGPNFRYDEAFGHKSFLKAIKETIVLWLTGLFLLLAVRVPWLKEYVKQKSPKPGEGPSRRLMERGHWRCDFIGQTEEKVGKPKLVRAILKGKGDPGYNQTSRMLLEAGLCLLHNPPSSPCLKGGVLTPASGLGTAYIKRLEAAGISFQFLADGKEDFKSQPGEAETGYPKQH